MHPEINNRLKIIRENEQKIKNELKKLDSSIILDKEYIPRNRENIKIIIIDILYIIIFIAFIILAIILS